MSATNYGNAESVLMRASTYKSAYKIMAIYAAVATGVACVGVGSAVYLALTRPEPRYFATTSNGQIQPLTPLDRPHMSSADVLNFAVRAVSNSLTYSFDNYRAQFQESQQFFSQPDGWNSFVDAVSKSKALDLVRNGRFNSFATVPQTPVIVRQGTNASGSYEWIVQMPIRITYQSASEVSGQSNMVTVRLTRLPTYETPYGIAISQFNAAAGG
ncbi:type IVB secretion system apparatus protein IcmL/DotI [Aureimonas pseudogalii]|uniref:Intracellular multiplication protein IcmL n=1 Tax=Aureimonas pseudogalii TaxID=1744844 RepID=A0A7W6H7P1_9HYPH|nr:type IVB secretion system apparatus protein IcmL/DotI [Aureimonas pseudogalii]MBB4000101.1 intracellular multiplication protein IcmL [Aureimonas pseudogalii]